MDFIVDLPFSRTNDNDVTILFSEYIPRKTVDFTFIRKGWHGRVDRILVGIERAPTGGRQTDTKFGERP